MDMDLFVFEVILSISKERLEFVPRPMNISNMDVNKMQL